MLTLEIPSYLSIVDGNTGRVFPIFTLLPPPPPRTLYKRARRKLGNSLFLLRFRLLVKVYHVCWEFYYKLCISLS